MESLYIAWAGEPDVEFQKVGWSDGADGEIGRKPEALADVAVGESVGA